MKMSALTLFSVLFCIIGLMIVIMILTPKILYEVGIPSSLNFINRFCLHMDRHEFVYNVVLFIGVILSIMGVSFGYESYIDKHYI